MLTTGMPSGARFLALLNNAGHAPIFAALALIALQLLRYAGSKQVPARLRPWHYLAAFVITLALGIAVEWAQSFIGRGASLGDVITDAMGASAALCLAAAWQARAASPRRGALLIGAAFLSIAVVTIPLIEAALAYQRRHAIFPELAAFDGPLGHYFVAAAGSDTGRTHLPEAFAGGLTLPALRVVLARPATPGLRFNEPAPDWRGYDELKLDLTNPGPQPLRMMIRVHDAQHDQRHGDRFNRTFVLPSGSRKIIAIALQDIENAPDRRKLDLGKVAGVVLFERSRPAPVGATFYLHRIWLEKVPE